MESGCGEVAFYTLSIYGCRGERYFRKKLPYIAKPNPASISFEIGEEKILPYYDAAKDEYRLLRKPRLQKRLQGIIMERNVH